MEYARRHRWVINILEPLGSVRDGILIYAHKCGRPVPEVDQIKIHHGQDEIYRPGKNRWSPIDISFYEKAPGQDKLINETAQRLYRWFAQTTIITAQSIQGDLSTYLKSTTVKMVDGAGNGIWNYFLYNSWPMKITPTELDYADTSLGEITMTLSFDKAVESENDQP